MFVTDGDEEVLSGGWQTRVVRRGGVVLRDPKPQSRAIVSLLQHLANEGFDAAPRPVGDGFSADGREQLTYVAGRSPQPRPWTDDAVWQVGRLLRRLHDITAPFEPIGEPQWHPWFARSLPGTRPVIGHGDLGPWNILARDNQPVAFIDWDNAGPVDALWELAHVVWLNAQLHDDDVAVIAQLPPATDRAKQARLILDGYGLERNERPHIVDMMIELAVRSARQEALDHAVTRDSTAIAPNGYPVLWAITWRARAAAWLLDHRTLLESTLTHA